MMKILAVSARGQVTLRKKILRHLGIEPGDKPGRELLPGGGLQAIRPSKKIDSFVGILAPVSEDRHNRGD
jgi:antitoxin PrlF